jgi:hypothetical protein
MSEHFPHWTKEREQRLRADVTARLLGVCSDWPEAKFRELIEKIVRTSMKDYQLNPGYAPPKPPSPDPITS